MERHIAHYGFLLVPISVGLMIPAMAIPWLTINFLGTHPFSPADMFSASLVNSGQKGEIDVMNILSTYKQTHSVAIGSVALYVVSMAAIAISAVWPIGRRRVAFAAGLMAFASSALWLYAFQSLKDDFASQAAVTGGIIGEEFKGHESGLADALIWLGTGQYFVAAGAAAALISCFADKRDIKKRSASCNMT